MNTIRICSAAMACAMLSVLATAASASPRTGTLSGQVRDTKGKPLAGARLEIMETGESTKADSHGNYSFTDETPGSYTVKADSDRYKAESLQATILPDIAERLDLVLEPSSTRRVVTTKKSKPGASVIVKWYSGPRTRQVYPDPQETFQGDLGLHSTARSR